MLDVLRMDCRNCCSEARRLWEVSLVGVLVRTHRCLHCGIVELDKCFEGRLVAACL